MTENREDFEQKPLFQLFLLKNDRKESVEVEEVAEINFKKIEKHLELGEAIFITKKSQPKMKKNPNHKNITPSNEEFVYITHI